MSGGDAGAAARDPRTVLVVRALGLGDALVTVPALKGLRRRWPAARLVLAGPAPVGGWLRDLGVVDVVLPASGLAPLSEDLLTRAVAASPGILTETVDVAVNMHGTGPQSTAALWALRPRRVLAYAGPHHPAGPPWDWDEPEVDRWVRLVAEVGAPCSREDLPLVDAGTGRGSTVVVHPGAASAARRWPADRWAAVVARLAASGRDVVVTGGPAEAALCAEVAAAGARDLSGALDVTALAALVAGAGLVLCGDTGVGHLATATRTPSVLLFGPSRPHQWGPAVDLDRHLVLWPAPPGYQGDAHAGEVDPVLAAISVDDVLGAVERLDVTGRARETPDDPTCPAHPAAAGS